jgi:hypothetical protein
MSEIDPVQFGELRSQVSSLSKQVDSLDSDMKELLALANKGRGAFWMGMTIASAVGAFTSWVVGHWFKG